MTHEEVTKRDADLMCRIDVTAQCCERALGVLDCEAMTVTAKRWLAISRQHFQEGLMAARRAVVDSDQF